MRATGKFKISSDRSIRAEREILSLLSQYECDISHPISKNWIKRKTIFTIDLISSVLENLEKSGFVISIKKVLQNGKEKTYYAFT